MLSVIKLNVIMLNVIKLSVIMLNVIMLNVIKRSVIIPSVKVPSRPLVKAKKGLNSTLKKLLKPGTTWRHPQIFDLAEKYIYGQTAAAA